ncbi:C-type lectin lectoxin-Thr1 [Amphibalanus amphitrite]|uniref:C-type lectin lectoxin-Thr1 n=1 Tax=Amphibalanus amphitrite TaxID=1232801 RepID=A0A6A4VJP5_AMPAM|nr:C-type lectin lectoxin-Thr1 [Amphibalanus amphitrite]
MDALRPLAVLLLSCALLAGASYVRRSDAFSAGLLSESAAPSRLSCAAWCNRTSGCGGFTFTADGRCRLSGGTFSSPPAVEVTEVDYTPPPAAPCRAGWHPFRDRCFLRQTSSVSLIRSQSRQACQGLGEDVTLATPNDDAEASWMLFHPSRKTSAEFIGLKYQSGVYTDLDGTAISFQNPVPPTSVTVNSCLNLRWRLDVSTWGTLSCSDAKPHYICESPTVGCLSQAPCPQDWLALDHYCYHYVSAPMAWEAADAHCTSLQPTARLAVVPQMGLFHILHRSLSMGADVLIGITDSAAEGSFQAVDGTAWSIDWATGEPNGAERENCVQLSPTGASDIPCTDTRPFLCRMSERECLL